MLEKIKFRVILIELAFVCLVALLTFAPSLASQFVFVDTYVTGPFASNLRADNFWTELFMQSLIRPLSQPWLRLSFAQDLGYVGAEAIGFRLVNVILHILSCLYLYVLTFRIIRHLKPVCASKLISSSLAYDVAFLSSLLFACHPLTTQSVAYIAGREGVLVGANCLLALNLFLLGFWSNRAAPIILGYLGAFLCTVMGIETSAEGLAIPILLFAAALLLGPKLPGKSVFEVRRIELIVLGALTSLTLLISATMTASSNFASNFGMPAPNRSAYIAAQFRGFLCYYLRCSFLPAGMSIEPPYFFSSQLADPTTMLGGAVFFGIAALAFLKRNFPALAFALIAVVVSYLPSLLILRAEYGCDERFYVPLAAICALIGFAFVWLAKGRSHLSIILGIVTIATLISLTVWRQSAWSSTLCVWQNARQVNQIAYTEAMVALFEVEGAEADAAKLEAERIVAADPNCQPALLALGKYEYLRKNHLAAKTFLQRAFQLCAEQKLNEVTHYQTSVIYLSNLLDLGETSVPSDAITYLLTNYSESDEVNFLAGRIALGQHQPMLAIRYLNKAFSFDRKNPECILALAQACLDSENPTLINNAYKTTRYISRRVPSPELRLIFAQAALEIGRTDECLVAADKAIAVFDRLKYPLTPETKAKGYYLSSLALSRLGRKSEAESALKKAQTEYPEIVDKVKIKFVKNGIQPPTNVRRLPESP